MNMYNYLFKSFDVSKQDYKLSKKHNLYIQSYSFTKKNDLIKKIKDFESISNNLRFLSDKLNKNFSDTLNKKINEFQKNIEDPDFQIEKIIKAYNELPENLTKADSEKVTFISNMCSVEKFKGKKFNTRFDFLHY